MKLTDFAPTVFKSFNACFFTGLLLLALFDPFARMYAVGPDKDIFTFFIIPVFNGLLCMGVVTFFNYFLSKHTFLKIISLPEKQRLQIVAFTAGFLCIFISTKTGTLLLGIFVIYLTIKKIKTFGEKMASLLKANAIATARDVGDFFSFFIDLIITFSLVNLTLHVAEKTASSASSFNFGDNVGTIFNTLYFTVVTMTTVGYGDITPQTYLSKIIVVLECLTSYVMFGLMIGILSRGVDFNKDS